MKKILLFLALCFCTHFVWAQTTTGVEKAIKAEVGVNASLFFRQFLNVGNSANLPDNPFLFTYKHHFQRFILRGGVGVIINTATETNPKFLDTRKTSDNSYNLRIGYEKQFPIYKKLRGYWGADLVGSYAIRDLRIDSGFDIVSTFENTLSVGTGGVLGFEYEFGKRFALGTETAFYYRYQLFEEKARFSNNPEFNNSGKKIVSNKTQFLPPLSIFGIMKF